MLPDGSVNDMYRRLNVIFNDLKGLGATYTNLEVAQKMLRAVPDKYETLVTILINSDMSRMTPTSLLGKINTNDMYKLNKQEIEEASSPKKKRIALKAKVEDKGNAKVDEGKEDLEEEIALLAKRFNDLLGRRNGRGKDSNSHRRRGRRGSHKSISNLRCFECEDKPSKKKSGKDKLFKKLKKEGKKVFVCEWDSNCESSSPQSDDSDESNDEGTPKKRSMVGVAIKEAPLCSPFCLMAKGSSKNNELKEQVAKLNKSLKRCFKGS
ncbi:hypothetical protein E2562_039354 [Oryza meyeriana var. granulata]|uniref:Uncharacterized protein n=1 Tax=Oryza meyeriana var. granulata TaxID=110450 RepID=A0A6G1DB20_9ORYZ|nr:hypothetical protein E2562_039354 [Oryza meyeriana var. granulata]